jgi:hypothetical protein
MTSPLHDELLRYIFVVVCVVHSLTTAHSLCMHTCIPEENGPSTCLAKFLYEFTVCCTNNHLEY